MKKLLNKISTIKNTIKTFLDKSIKVFKIIVGDKIDISVLITGSVLAIIDIITKWDLTGVIALLVLYIVGLLIRLALWKLKNK